MQYDEKTLKEEIYKYVRNLNTNERKKRLEILRGEFNHYDYYCKRILSSIEI